MICQPMRGLTEEEILANREEAIKKLQNGGYEVINTVFNGYEYTDEYFEKNCIKQKPVYYLGKSLEHMALCNVVYFCKGWEEARGCRIEHEVATAYGIPVLYER